MEREAMRPAWRNTNGEITFEQNTPAHILRGWERAPQPSHLVRHKGRKVWKRPEIRGKELFAIDEQRSALNDVVTNTTRPVKRLRVKDGIVHGKYSEGGGFANYVPTLHDDGATGTPKRKRISKEIATSEEVRKETEKPAEMSPKVDVLDHLEVPKKDYIVGEIDDIEDTMPQASEIPQADVRDVLEVDRTLAKEAKPNANTFKDRAPSLEDEDAGLAEPADVAVKQARHNRASAEICTPGSKVGKPNFEATLRMPEIMATYIEEADAVDAVDHRAISEPKTSISQSGKDSTTSTSGGRVESQQELNSPQIGTTLLRRESLRSRGSPRTKGSAQKIRTPENRHGLKKRDTLQEREILQQFNAAASPTQITNTEILSSFLEDASPRKLSPRQSLVAKDIVQSNDMPTKFFKEDSPTNTIGDTQTSDVVIDKKTLESKDLARAVEAIEVCQNPTDDEITTAHNSASLSSESLSHIDQASNFVAESEIHQAAKTIAEVCEKADFSTRKTRSDSRISDDTSMLKDFLNRAQAKKAAKKIPLLLAELPKLQGSPSRQSPHKALKPHSGNFISPQKHKKSTKRPSTPPRKAFVEESDSSDGQEVVNEPSPFRRSQRTRLPAPSKTPSGAPSFIPVRRGDGSDPIVLQKSQAQEMAIATRANTRRNKGQSKPPVLALQDLPAESPLKMTAKERAAHAKKVAWAEKLASYQESMEAPEEAEEQRPKFRRMRGLGAVNGTPAKKTTAAVSSSNGTPAPKRRGRMR